MVHQLFTSVVSVYRKVALAMMTVVMYEMENYFEGLSMCCCLMWLVGFLVVVWSPSTDIIIIPNFIRHYG